MSSFISAAPVASGQVQSLDSVRGHSLPSDAVIMASSSLVTPTNQNTGSYALVESANALTLTTTGSVPVVTQSPFADLYKEGSIYFNGTVGNYISGTATGLMGTQWNTTGLTVEAWVNYPTFTGAGAVSGSVSQPYLVGQFQPAGATNYWGFGSNTLGYVTFFYFNGASQNITSSVPLSTNTWNHIAFSCLPGGATANVYVNGTSVASTSISGTPTVSLSVPLTLGQFNSFSPNLNCYVADVRITTGAALYTGASFTVPSAPLSTAATGVTQALIRAGQNSPTVQNGALTFDRGLKQFQNYGPQTFNIVTQGFTAIWRGAFTGTAGSYERIFEFISSSSSSTNNAGSNGILLSRNGTASSLYFTIQPLNNAGTPSAYGLTGGNLSQNVPYVVTARYSPVTQLLDLWVNGVFQASASATPAQLVGDRILGFTSVGWFSSATYTSMTSNVLAIYNRALSNVEIYNSYLALNTVPATPLQKTLEIGDINGTPALSVAGDGKVSVQSIGLSSNVVQWPPAAMTGYVTSINGKTYVASASSDQGIYYAWNSFLKTAVNPWLPSGSYSTTSPYGYTGAASTTDVNGTVYKGEWLQIQLPNPITLSSYFMYVYGATYAPQTWSVLGSRDGVNWFLVNQQPSYTFSFNGSATFNTVSTGSYNYFRMVVLNIQGPGVSTMGLYLWTLYGTADTSPALTIAPATTFNTSVATPSLTGIAAAGVYAPQDFSTSGLNIPAYVVSNTATVANTVAYSSFGPFAGEGSLYFPGGTGQYVNFGQPTQLAYNWTSYDFTIEMFVFSLFTPSTDQRLFARDYEQLIYITTNNTLRVYMAGVTGPTSGAFIGGAVPQNQWSHVAVSWSQSAQTMYISVNGSVTAVALTAGTPTYAGTRNVVMGTWAGTNGLLNTSISNLRFTRGLALYTAAFTPPTGPLQPIQGTTQAGQPYGTVLLLRNAPAPGRIQTTKFSGANSGTVLSFPPAAMTGYAVSLNSGYGQGTYVASASSENTAGGGYYSYRAFEKGASTIPYSATGSLYAASGAYTGTVRSVDVNGTSYSGEWLQIQMPSSVVLSTYSLQQRQDGYGNGNGEPTSWTILGSNDGTNWSLVDQRTFTAWAGSATFFTFTVASQRSFSFYRFVGSTVGSSAGTNNLCFAEWTLNGTIESVNVTADGRVGLGVVNPTRALEVAGDVVCGGTLSAGNPLMFRNALYNGDMRIAQRGTSFSSLGSVYTLDRWYISQYGAAGVGTVSQIQSGLANFSNALQLAVTSTTAGNWYISQSLETRDVVRFQGQPVTVSLWYRIPVNFTSQWSAELVWNTSVDTKQPDVSVSSTSAGYLVLTNTTAWTYGTFTGFVPPTAQALTVRFLSYNNTVNGAQFQVTGVQLEKGSVATPYEILPYATELALCQRYYYRVGGDSNYQVFGSGSFIGSTTLAQVYIPFPVTMRVGATGGNFSNSAVTTFWFGSGSGPTCTAVNQVGDAQSRVGNQITFTTSSAVTAGTGCMIEANNTTSAFLAFNAEL